MNHLHRRGALLWVALLLLQIAPVGAQTTGEAVAGAAATPALRLDAGHPWRLAFGLARVGRPSRIAIEARPSLKPGETLALAGFQRADVVSRAPVDVDGPYPAFAEVAASVDRVALIAAMGGAEWEVASLRIERAAFEAAAEAVTEQPVNPIDLGAILPPRDWLLLGLGQRARLRVAAFSREEDLRGAKVEAWFDSRPASRTSTPLELRRGERAEFKCGTPEADFGRDRDILHVSIRDSGGAEVWSQEIKVMLVASPPAWPKFGATETRLRYDPPISVRDPKTGKLSSMPYEDGWDWELSDIVVSLPNGSRFVFWRGSSYVPFWAGAGNTGLSYEWAEAGPPPKDSVDCVEPLMDKELRYGRAQILESTQARVHVRWTYQSCDFNYKVWGDAAREDFYFYPDGFGTRVLTLTSALDSDYEVSEFIVLAPPEGYPLELLPTDPIRALALDGSAVAVPIPFLGETLPTGPTPPLVYRVQFHKDAEETAVYFNPRDTFRAEELVVFRPFRDQGQLVTPAYWGSHWPLARGNSTGGSIDDRIHVSPSHNSLMSWAHHRPDPIWSRVGPVIDTLGDVKEKRTQCWAWLIGVTGESDASVIERARSFAEPASLEIKGAEPAVDSYVPERRAYRLLARARRITIKNRSTAPCVNPVFEIENAPTKLLRVEFAGRTFGADKYAWDGRTLWLGVAMDPSSKVGLEFGE